MNEPAGRRAIRFEDEPPDGRPVVVYPFPAWRSRHERLTYEAAVAGNPIRQGEGHFAYIVRISKVVTDEASLEAAGRALGVDA